MANTVVSDPPTDDKDDALVIMVNADGTITVDQETLQRLIASQHPTNVSVVRVDGETPADDTGESHVNLTVEGYFNQQREEEPSPPLNDLNAVDNAAPCDVDTDPFSQMDPEHLARLESALQSEQAKEILGTKLEDSNLSEMLEILEGKDDVRVRPPQQEEAEDVMTTLVEAHNDHSYTNEGLTPIYRKVPVSQVPASRPPQTVVKTEPIRKPLVHSPASLLRASSPASTPRPVVRANRSVRPTKITRPGSVQGPNVIVVRPPGVASTPGEEQQLQQKVVSIPKQPVIAKQSGQQIIQRTKLVNKAGEEIKTVRKVITKLPAPGLQRVGVTSEKRPLVIPAQKKSPVSQKVVVGKKRPSVEPGTAVVVESRPTTATPKGDSSLATASTTASPKTAQVVLEKLSTTTSGSVVSAGASAPTLATPQPLAVASPGAHEKKLTKTRKPESLKLIQQEMTKYTTSAKTTVLGGQKTPTPAAAPPAALKTPETPSTPGGESKKIKKEKPKVLGPELFSTPDVIRRVSTDKEKQQTPTNVVASQPQPSLGEPVTQVRQIDDAEAPRVQVQTLPTLIPVTKCDTISPESLLDSIHAEVVKGDPVLDESLLRELTCDDDAVAGLNAIEETLQKMEADSASVSTTLPPTSPQPQEPSHTVTTPATNERIRKLPPIELPTTRSASKKKAAAVTGDATEPTTTPSPVAGVVQTPPAATKMEKRPGQKASPVKERRPSEKTARKSDVRRASSSSEKKSKPDKKSGDDEDDDDDEEVESGDDSWNSEDDPDRLWCICQKPHNNRFMICCDVCADWFHGKCVGITKALGQQMEQQGVDWTCPKCKQAQMKKAAESSSPMNQRPSISKGPTQQQLVALECLVCKKPAKAASIFCSDVCVKKHAKMSLFMLKREVEGLNISTRVVVCEKKTGRMLTGDKAPTVELLADWLVKHPTFEVLNPNVLPPNKYYAKSTNKPQPVKSEKPALKQSVLQTRVNQSGVKTVGFGPKGAVKEKKPPTAGSTGQQAHAVKVKNEGEAQLLAKKLVTSQTSGASSPARKPKEDAAPGTPGSSTSTGSSTATSATTAPAPPKAKRPRKEPPAQSSDAGATTKTEGAEKENEQQAPSAKSMIEPVRANVRRTLQELLNKRVKADPEIEVPVADIKALVENIEAELFNHFQDTNAKYKAKYRSLVFNINDPKNLTLYRKIVDKAVSPAQLVRMSPDELASQELAQWREKEQKHQLEIIKKNELELIHQAKTVVLKSRKGEEVIQSKNHEANISELESALNRTAEDVQEELNGIEKKEAEVTPVPSIVAPPSPSSSSTSAPLDKEKKKDEPSRKRDRERRRNRDRRHRSRSRSKRIQSKDRSSSKSSSRRDSKKSRSPSKERPLKRKSRSHSRERVEKMKRSRSSEMKERKPERKPEKVSVKVVVIKKEPSEKKDQSADGDQRSLTPPPPSSGLSGSVAVKKEDDLSDREPSSTVTIATPPYSDEKQSVWTGTLNMTDVARIRCSMFEVSGSCDGLDKELSNWLDCIGRIPPESVWDYVSRMKKAGTKDIVVVRFHAEQEEERANYMSFYTYLHSRGRMAVVEHASTSVKDFYVLPLANHAPIPQVLLPLDGPGFDDFRPNLLLGIVIRSKRGKKRGQEVAESSRVKSSRSSKSERSYTPPLPGQRKRSKPPLPTVGSLDEPEDESLDPDLNEPYSPGDGDENEAYSPGDSDPPSAVPAETPKPAIASSTTTAAAASTPDIQKNLEEVNRMIEEKRQKLESMTSYPAIPGLGGSPPPYSAVLNIKVNDDDDENAAYSPPDSFTPPHPGIPTGVPAPASSSSSSSTAAPSIPSFLDTKALPDIKLPSNLQEILASIKVKPPQPASGESGSSAPSDIKGSDPIVQAYTTQPSSEVEDDASRDTVEMRTTRARSSAVAAAAAAAAASASATASRSRDPRQRPEPPTCVLPTAPTLPGSEPVGVGTTVSASGPPRVPPDYTTLAAAARGAPPPAVFFPPHIGPPPILSHAFQALPPQPPTVEPPRNNPAWVQPPSTVPRMFMPPPPPPQFRNFRMGAPGGSPGGFRGATPGGPPQHRLQNEWDKEIREFEARKVRHMDRDMRDRGDRDRDRDRDRNRDRRKRKSRSPPRRNSRSPRRRSSRRPSLPSN